MKRVITCLMSVALLLAAVVPAGAQKPAKKIRVLLTYGGHGFEQKPFFALFDSLAGVEVTKAEMPKDADLLRPELRQRCDVLVMYDMVPSISPEQRSAFVALLQKGIGVVSLHHNLGAHRDWDEFRKIIGGKFIFSPCTLEGKLYKKSTWSHGETLHIMVADQEHPITKGLKDFDIHDETYGGYYTASNVHVLLKTNHPKNNPEIAWTNTYGNSRVFYLQLGHDHFAWQNPNYGKILSRAIRWAAGR